MVYQDHLTKLCILRPLQTKRAAEVAFQLVDIFLLMGAPAGLQSDNGSEFTSRVITELKEIWTSLTMVHGKPVIHKVRVLWNVRMVTLRIWIKCSPYSAMFGCEARVGLTSSPLPTEVVSRLESEDDPIAVIRLNFEVGKPGDNSAVPIPAVDRGRGDPRNILSVIVSRQ
ncbi:KRAB-A domain-containing protein 2-like [Penaeus monodon]|uniref:KRAB-A domain-containing protein 2-like n=1 Tax=Penaeus monodon TaxID=6687 RepID=UPI0018A75D0F|nr:KRAB-A domain-containing protein 2-like [Penaeus monodon]